MLEQDMAVQLVSQHLRVIGHEVEEVLTEIGGTPIIRTKRRDGEQGLTITFPVGVSTCCGARAEPADWEHTVQWLRRTVALARRVETDDISPSELFEEIVHRPDCVSALKGFGDDSARRCFVVVVSGSIVEREQELSALASEIGIGLMLIDDQHVVLSAGLTSGRTAFG
jgi:hypothetical protein